MPSEKSTRNKNADGTKNGQRLSIVLENCHGEASVSLSRTEVSGKRTHGKGRRLVGGSEE